MAKKQIFLTEKQIEKLKEQLVSTENTQKRIFFTENQVSELKQKIQQAREETNTNPTEKQKEAGNYKMGKVSILGFNIAIENPKGSYRRGKDKTGKEWKTLMHNDYGYFTHTLAIDGDAVDVFLGDNLNCSTIFAIDQKIDGKFDETKVMFGFKSAEEAKKAYLSNYEKGWKGFWKITEVNIDIFKKWLYDGYKQRKPFFDYADIKKEKLNENLLTENDDWHKYYDYIEEYDEYTVLKMLDNDENLWAPLIQPAMYQQALNEFTKTGRLEKFPTKYIYQWMGIIMKNAAIIRAITSIAGHDMEYPTYEIIDACFNSREDFEKYKSSLKRKGTFSPDFGWMENDDEENDAQEVDDDDAVCQYLEDNGYYDKMRLPDGSDAWSDFGIRPLEEIIYQYNDSLEPEQVLVLINKALDVTHQRGDLASAFIDGGWNTLSKISNGGYVNENAVNNAGYTKLYHSTTYKNLANILNGGVMRIDMPHKEGHGDELWFSVKPNDYGNEIEISIQVPQQEFGNNYTDFQFVNTNHVVVARNLELTKYHPSIEQFALSLPGYIVYFKKDRIQRYIDNMPNGALEETVFAECDKLREQNPYFNTILNFIENNPTLLS